MSFTPDQSKKVGLGLVPSPSPFLTPRPERRRTDPRLADWNSSRQDNRDKETNVQVLLRCRPLNDDEIRSNVPRVISCNEHKREVTVIQNLANKQVDRAFTFDKVCFSSPSFMLYDYFASMGGDLPAEAGVIPRAVRQIFDMLEAQNADYSLKVTFSELYNEEITDLLAPEDNSRSTEDKQKKPISLMEDGKGCVIVRGLEEEAVYSVNEIYTLLERGAAKRRTADTLLNKRSSRSHSIFSITVYIKEAALGDEELIKCGKLNLVDLAGSENISRSGAREGRAREAGEINKSLLTLGRVINALVEHSAHIPYRDSKLTRLLRDSLGGKTKTCIIATISPSAHCLDETLSTLDYACRAKNIKNKPEANQKMSKAVLLKDLYSEIERMKEDVRAARDKNGVYIPHERFSREEAEKKARNEKIEQLENDLSLSEKQVDRFRELYVTEQEQKLDFESELKDCKINLESSNKALLDLQESYRLAISTLKEKEFIISKLLCSENSLVENAKQLRTNLQSASEDIDSLFTKLDQKDKMETENQSMVLNFGSQLDQSLKDLHRTILGSVSQQQLHLRCMEEHVHSHLASKSDATQALESRIKKMAETYTSGVATLKELANAFQRKASSDLEEMNSTISLQATAVENFLVTAVSEASEVICDIQNSLDDQKQLLAFSTRQQEEGLQRSFVSAQVISKATVEFFNNLYHRSSKVMTILEESQTERYHQLVNFEKMFKDKAAREEKQALEKIAGILATLTSSKTAMVSEAARNIQDSSIHESKKLKQEMSEMQQVSTVAKEELGEYIEKAESHFIEDTFSATESRAIMEECLHDLKRVDYSWQQWGNAQSSINSLNKTGVADMESTVKENIYTNHFAHEEFVSASSSVNADFDAGACELSAAVNDSLMLDHENKKEIDSMTTLCLDQIKLIQETHGTSISDIRSQAEKCLVKDYLVDNHTSTTPKKRVIVVPSLASIEEMRTPAYEISEKGVKLALTESKIPHLQRTPFAYLN
ncbi:kinesin-like protein kin-5b [Quercus suber]|uniref:Kinesin-like protein kin-5b n=1 Tax=Quercus suber TaxID=58331 RepID=A0AAW0LN11_QUESU